MNVVDSGWKLTALKGSNGLEKATKEANRNLRSETKSWFGDCLFLPKLVGFSNYKISKNSGL